ncbi:MAG TPA: efflux RND transporter periplasmic adaptor subunit [Mariprofundaceae bacterium]|nr:efflux RND transporter periplasmic adaptor subunit [Mariprofundaceae bacterium]
MKKRMTIMLVSVAVLFGAVIGFQQFKAYMMGQWLAGNGLPPATVTAMEAKFEQWQPKIRSVGSLRARQGAMIVAERASTVEAVHFKAGEEVRAGKLLLELEAGEEKAQFKAAKAAQALAKITLERDQEQIKVHAISQAKLDAAKADFQAKQAQVEQLQAVLDKLQIHAPFSGRLGVSTISVGQYMNAGATIISLQASDKMLIDFNIPQRQLAEVKAGQSVSLHSSTFAGRHFKGEIVAIDSRVDTNTRNVHVEALIDNAKGDLVPGMFAEVYIETGASKAYLTLPQTAITYNAYGTTVFVARPGKPSEDGKEPMPVAEQIFVKTGAVRGDQVALLSGINEGDIVVTSGQMKLKNGTPLIINNTHPPANEAAPTPQER